jgi:superfamily II DNA helicase RecQ
VENAVFDLARAGHGHAWQWQQAGRSPVLEDGRLDPRFVEQVVQRQPEAAETLTAEQEAARVPRRQRLSTAEAIALGVTMQRPAPDGRREIPRPPARRRTPTTPATAEVTPDSALFEQLRAWRLQEAQQTEQKAFYVFPDATLKRIAAARPQTLEELGAVKGVGPRKLAQYGQAVLDITREEGGKET